MYGYKPSSPQTQISRSLGSILSLTIWEATTEPCCRVMAPMMARIAPFITVSTPDDWSFLGYGNMLASPQRNSGRF